MLCIAGKNDIACNVLDFSVKRLGKNNVCGIINGNDEGIDMWQKSFSKACKLQEINIITLEEAYKINDLIFISVEFDKIINPEKFVSKRLFNIHFSKLPKYRGMYTSVWPILSGEKETGVTLHEIDFGIDTGNIIDQISFSIGKEDTSRDLYFKYLKYGYSLIQMNFENLISGNYLSIPQSIEGSSYYSRDSIDYKNIIINFNKPAENIVNQIRAFFFPEYQVPICFDKKIEKCRILSNRSKKRPGTLIEQTSNELIIATHDYDVALSILNTIS